MSGRSADTLEAAPVRIDVFTLFREAIEGYAALSILGRARAAGLVDLRTHDIRAFAAGPHRAVDGPPFGGGAGMVLAPDPVFAAVEEVESSAEGLPVRCCSCPRRADGSTKRSPPSLPAVPGVLAARRATRGSTSGWPTIWSTVSSRWETSCWPGASWPHWS